jgi:glycogen debranching enzyme
MYRLIGLLIFVLALGGCTKNLNHAVAPWQSCFQGVSNKGKTSNKIYVTAGRKAQIIGLQDGTFPAIGEHLKGEMGGIWTGSFKLADGFDMKLANITSNDDTILHAREMIVFPHKNCFDFGDVLDGVHVSSTQFSSDKEPGVVVSYVLTNKSQHDISLSVGFGLNVDIVPVWFSEENGIYNGNDYIIWDKGNELFTAGDSLHNWFMAWRCDHKVSSYEVGEKCQLTGAIPAKFYSILDLHPGQQEEIRYVITSSIKNSGNAVERCNVLLDSYEKELLEKKNSIETLLSTAEIDIPDKKIQDAFYWTKINNRWLETDIDTIGYFLSAGAVEYPWLFGCDNSYALQGQVRVGDWKLVESTLRLLNKVSERINGNGQIIHEMSNNGFVGNKGNTQETAHYIMAVWEAYRWTGDIQLLHDLYPNVKKGISWLTETMDTNHNLYPEGYGIMEVKGLNAELIDVAVYTQQALVAASKMASLFGEDSLATTFSLKADKLKEKINHDFWDEQQCSYCDFYGTAGMALKAVSGAIDQAKLSPSGENEDIIPFYEQLRQNILSYDTTYSKGWFTNKNWVINTPMECGIAPYTRGVQALKQIRQYNCGEYGPYLSAVEKKQMMTISTGVQAVAEAKYRRIDSSVEYLGMIANTLGLNMPGAINEMMPDYGCAFQAWTIYGMATGLISGCFGIEPYAADKTIIVAPQLPEKWNNMALRKLRVGDNYINLSVKRDANSLTLSYDSQNEGWKTGIYLPGMSERNVNVNGKNLKLISDTLWTHEKSTILKISN